MSIGFPPGPSPSVAAQAALQHVTATVAVASGLAATGRKVDLAGIEAVAGRLCAQLLDLPPEAGAQFRPALMALDQSIASLSTLLRGRRA